MSRASQKEVLRKDVLLKSTLSLKLWSFSQGCKKMPTSISNPWTVTLSWAQAFTTFLSKTNQNPLISFKTYPEEVVEDPFLLFFKQSLMVRKLTQNVVHQRPCHIKKQTWVPKRLCTLSFSELVCKSAYLPSFSWLFWKSTAPCLPLVVF